MTDIERAVQGLEGHSICLCREGDIITDDGKGISPMIKFISEGRALAGYSAADAIVGRAAAMLFVKAGIAAVHGKVMSQGGSDFLAKHGIPHTWDVLTEQIINRAGTGVCPMEQAVDGIDDPEEGYRLLCERLAQLRQK